MSKYIYGIFDDDDVLLKSIPALRSKKVSIKDVFTPFPVHGLDHALGLKRTRISICCFIYGCIGCSLALLMTYYMNIKDWPIDIGGKPNFQFYKNLAAFIPVTFESTVLCAAHGMAITFFLRSKILPGVTPFVPDVRMSDDKFVMMVELKDAGQQAEMTSLLKQHGASEVKEYEVNKN
jgi:hypothetical protein